MQPHPPVHMRSMFKASGPLLLTKILAFSAHWSQIKNMETEFEGNRKVVLILSQQREEHSRLTLKELPPPPPPGHNEGSAAAAKSLQSCPTLCDPIDSSPPGLPHPWDSSGKNTGVGCHFLLQCMKVKSESEVAQSCLTPSDPMDCSLPGSSVNGIFQARRGLGAYIRWGLVVRGLWWRTMVKESCILLPLALFQCSPVIESGSPMALPLLSDM